MLRRAELVPGRDLVEEPEPRPLPFDLGCVALVPGARIGRLGDDVGRHSRSDDADSVAVAGAGGTRRGARQGDVARRPERVTEGSGGVPEDDRRLTLPPGAVRRIVRVD